MKIKDALDTVIGSLICSISNENFNNCDHCPIRKLCDECTFEKNFNPLDETKVRSAVIKLWDEKTYEILEPVLVIHRREGQGC